MPAVTIEQAVELAIAHHQAGRLAEAEAIYRQVLAVEPANADALHLLGYLAHQTGHSEQGLTLVKQAIALRPNHAATHSNLGTIHRDMGRLDDAVAACRRAIELRPDFAFAWCNLGAALHDGRRLGEAIEAIRQAIRFDPGHAIAHNNLGTVFKDMGRMDEALASCRQALHLAPDSAALRSNLLLLLHYPHDMDRDAIFAEHRRWDEIHGAPAAENGRHPNTPDPSRRLRVGYVSPDFCAHSTAFFHEALIAGHDRSQCEVHCYSCTMKEDDVTARLKAYDVRWHDITRLSDEESAARIRGDGIDILVDLAGHTAHNRLPLFARKPAPVQATYLGYCDTTGLRAMDWRITDVLADPPEMTEHLHSERLWRLPGSAWCYRPPADSPPVSPPPCATSGRVTFGCFNVRSKITPELLRVWAALLRRVPDSRLVLKTMVFDDPAVRQDTVANCEAAGIPAEIITLLGFVPGTAAHLAAYAQVDIALDTFPYHGTTTTCEALWMGVPVVTRAGQAHASRVGVSLLTNAGLPSLITSTADEYADTAAALAADLPHLTTLRGALRERLRSSLLMDAPRFTRGLEAAYREMWRDWCERT